MPCLVIIIGSRRPPNTWYSSVAGLGDPAFKSAPMPTARGLSAAAPLGPGLAGVFGGYRDFNFLATNEVYNYDTNTWASRAPMPTTNRRSLAAAPLGPGLAGVFGGFNGFGNQAGGINEVYNYDTNTWARKASIPTPRDRLAAAPLGPGLAGVFGGHNAGNTLSVPEVYNYDTNTWASKASMPTAREYPAAAPLGPGLAGVFGGFIAHFLAINEVYNYNTNTWASKSSMPTVRGLAAAAPLGPGLAGVFGGLDYDNDFYHLDVNEVYNYDTNTWASRAPMPTARHGLAAAPLGPDLVGVFGGIRDDSYLNTNEVYSY